MRKVGSTTDTADANGEYTNGNVAQGVPPTIINAEMLNTFQRELIGIVEDAGIALDPTDDNQVVKSIKKIIADNFDSLISFNGFQKYSSGLVKQWGRVSANTDEQGNFTVTPTASLFPNGVLFGRVDMGESSYSGATRVIIINTYPNTTLKKNITAIARYADNGSPVASSSLNVTFDVIGN
ncbi:Uncharacterised protein [Serratia proteamaculans]|uniref:hypothetical protein n=1 Tax=Serratia proteamaculans TaxID=28151 RepID=UPI002177C1B6|nr:hypothetical protein [Serratia proteamaculans]CAI1574891.1 Uncharacterised protein [Serratia proteamaculans]